METYLLSKTFRLRRLSTTSKLKIYCNGLSKNGIWKPINKDNVNSYGAETLLGWKKQFGKNNFSANASYAYTASKDEETKKQLFFVPFNKVTGSVAYSRNRISAYYQFLYNGFVYTRADNNPDEIINDYTVSNLGIDYDFKFLDSFKLGFQVLNIFNEDYESSRQANAGSKFQHVFNFKILIFMKLSKLLLIALSVSLFVSCSSDDDNDESKGQYENGFFILNEGSAGQGSVSFSSDDFSVFTKDAYTAANGTDLLGKYAQNIFFDGDNAYIIAGGSNVINVVNRYTFKLIAKIDSGLANPRYGVVKDGKAYVTNANTYSYINPATGNTDDYVAIINLTTNKVESKIELNATADRLVLEDGKLYITEQYNNDKLLIVNITTKALETPVVIGSGADTIEEENGILYILRKPYGESSEIVKVKISDKSVSKVTFPETLDSAGFLDISDNKIYYTVGSSVYSINTSAASISTSAIFTASSVANLYGFAVNDNKIYLADSGDYKADSKAYIYNLTGTLQKELTVGVAPNGFYFND